MGQGTGGRGEGIGGVLVPETTPFDASGELDGAAFRSNVRAHIKSGVYGIVLAGSTGEAPMLGEDERERIVELAREIVPADKWLIAGVGAESTRATIWRARDAAARGADAVLVVAPHYYGAAMTDAALEAHYRRVADASTVPVVLYNIPKYAHFSLGAEMVGRLATHKNVIGIKDSSGDIEILKGYLTSQGEVFTVLTGAGGALKAGLEAGARGGILGVACFAALLALEVFDCLRRGDRDAAGLAQARLVPLAKEIVARGPAGVKCAMDAVGLHGGPVRSPLTDFSASEAAAVAALVKGIA